MDIWRDLQSRVVALEARVLRPRRGMYVPLAISDLYDSLGNAWNGAARNTGTYTFRPEDNSNLWPVTASALHVLVYGQWASASASYYLALRRVAVGANDVYLGCLVANFPLAINANMALGDSGYFYAVLAGANAAAAQVRLLGYYT